MYIKAKGARHRAEGRGQHKEDPLPGGAGVGFKSRK